MSALRGQYSRAFELLRRAVRNSIGFRSPVYQLGSSLLTSAEVIRREGYKTWKRLRALSNRKDASPELIPLRGLKHPIYVRPGTEDLATVINNVIREEYGQGQSFFTEAPRFMIDAGAFIGDTAAYFLSRFPKLNIVALEPNLENFSLARKNLAPYGNRVELLHSALGASAGNVRFRGQSTGGFVDQDGIPVSMTTVPLLLKSRPETPLDILKLDIEGEELAVLSDAASEWLPRVGQIMVEIHGRNIEQRVLPILSRNGFKVRRYRSIWLCTNTSWRSTF
jgi:FkbM family methyltransferase